MYDLYCNGSLEGHHSLAALTVAAQLLATNNSSFWFVVHVYSMHVLKKPSSVKSLKSCRVSILGYPCRLFGTNPTATVKYVTFLTSFSQLKTNKQLS